MALVVAPKLEGDQEEMKQFKRREFIFVEDFVVSEQLFIAATRPVEMRCRPVDERPLKDLGLGQPDRSFFSRKSQSETRRPQQRRIDQIRMVVGKLEKLGHANLLAHLSTKCQIGLVVSQYLNGELD